MGNAYQCTIAGPSTGAPTGTGSAINNGGAATFKFLSSIDYTSLQSWASGLPATLTQAVVAQLWNNGSITTTSGVGFLNLTGHATSPANSITITAAPGESFANASPAVDEFNTIFSSDFGGGSSAGGSNALAFSTTTGVNFVQPATGVGGINYFLIQDDHVFVTGLQFQDPNPTSGSTIFQSTQNCTVSGCIFDGYGQTGGASILNPALGGAATSVFTLTNSLVVDRANSGSTGISIVSVNINAVYANNTIVALNAPAGQGGIADESSAAGVTVKFINNILIGYSAGLGIGTNTSTAITVSYSLFDVSSLTGAGINLGAGNIYSKSAAVTFISPTTDFRLLSTSAAINAGFSDTTDIPSSTDVFGTSRPQGSAWDIGAYEFLLAGSIGTANGHGGASGVSGVGGHAIGTANGHGGASGVSGSAANVAIGTANGVGGASGVSTGNVAVGTANGQGGAIAYDAAQAINAAVTLNNPGPQTVNTPFQVSGTFTLSPDLQFANDNSTTFTPIPTSGITSLGTTSFTFSHPGIPSAGTDSLLVEDLSTSAAAAVSYTVSGTTTNPPPPPPIIAEAVFQPVGLTALSTIIPAYVYQQYADDDNVSAFFYAYNNFAQTYLNWFNGLNLPIYTGDVISGPLLDWVAQGIYGISRPTLAITRTLSTLGDFNTYDVNSIDINGSGGTSTSTIYTVTDDIFKRIITWNFYKGDGFTFSALWLKRRIARFLAGVNGTDYTGPTYQISVVYAGTKTINVTLFSGSIPLTAAIILQAAILDGNILPLPFQYTVNVLIKGT